MYELQDGPVYPVLQEQVSGAVQIPSKEQTVLFVAGIPKQVGTEQFEDV